jgi:hypothetical protein
VGFFFFLKESDDESTQMERFDFCGCSPESYKVASSRPLSSVTQRTVREPSLHGDGRPTLAGKQLFHAIEGGVRENGCWRRDKGCDFGRAGGLLGLRPCAGARFQGVS